MLHGYITVIWFNGSTLILSLSVSYYLLSSCSVVTSSRFSSHQFSFIHRNPNISVQNYYSEHFWHKFLFYCSSLSRGAWSKDFYMADLPIRPTWPRTISSRNGSARRPTARPMSTISRKCSDRYVSNFVVDTLITGKLTPFLIVEECDETLSSLWSS